MAEASLNNLCRICNNNPPKYTCPRCSSRTCSLACYKKHQARAQCSGKRDPSVYKRRHELATPNSIDHDFNFLTSIERAVDVGGKVAQKPFDGARTHNVSKEKYLKQFLTEQDICMHRAPKGLSREKENSTHWVAKNQCVMWTLEWFLLDSSRVLRNGRDTVPVKDLFRANFSNSFLAGQKRKRNTYAQNKFSRNEPDNKNEPQNAVASVPPTSQVSESNGIERQSENRAAPEIDKIFPHFGKEEAGVCRTTEDTVTPKQPLLSDLHFYLIKPHTGCQLRVLQPLDPEQPLRNSLQGKTLLEFPSIQVLTQNALELPAGFILEEEYQKKYQEQVRNLDDISTQGTGTTSPISSGDFKAPKEEIIYDPIVVDSALRDPTG